MKSFLLLAGILAYSTSAALAQTVLPSGAVAPTGVTSPATGVPTTPATRDGDSPRAARHDKKVPGLNHQDRKQMRKMDKMHYNSDSEKQAEKK
ncbi:hypothetical protein A0257_07930 [Hymenobacter psoromatis]|nr:hypothetical protein A0257_07930 [Hymenobacter psoromatis]